MLLLCLLPPVSMGCVLILVGGGARCLSSRFWFAMLEESLGLLGALCVGFILLSLEFSACHGIDYCGLLLFYSRFHASVFCCACVLQHLLVTLLLFFWTAYHVSADSSLQSWRISQCGCEVLFSRRF